MQGKSLLLVLPQYENQVSLEGKKIFPLEEVQVPTQEAQLLPLDVELPS